MHLILQLPHFASNHKNETFYFYNIIYIIYVSVVYNCQKKNSKILKSARDASCNFMPISNPCTYLEIYSIQLKRVTWYIHLYGAVSDIYYPFIILGYIVYNKVKKLFCGGPIVISLSVRPSIHTSFHPSILPSVCPSKISCQEHILSPLCSIWLILHPQSAFG